MSKFLPATVMFLTTLSVISGSSAEAAKSRTKENNDFVASVSQDLLAQLHGQDVASAPLAPARFPVQETKILKPASYTAPVSVLTPSVVAPPAPMPSPVPKPQDNMAYDSAAPISLTSTPATETTASETAASTERVASTAQPPLTVAQTTTKTTVHTPARDKETRLGMGTLPGFNAGLQASRYKYHETLNASPFVNNKGYKAGIEADYTYIFDDTNIFATGEGRFTYGKTDYTGSGVSKNHDDYITEFRGLLGVNYVWNSFGASPYAGFGVRDLYNDNRGITSTNKIGYRRESHYEYIPVGVTTRFRTGENSRVAVNAEYDHFTRGQQRSILKDVATGVTTLENDQKEGYFAARGSVMYETPLWSFGPWFNYWHIADSEVSCNNAICGMEPNNYSTEFGLRISRKLF